MPLMRKLGFNKEGNSEIGNKRRLIQYINLKLAAKGFPYYGSSKDNKFIDIAEDLISTNLENGRLLSKYLCPADYRIQKFLNNYFSDTIDSMSIKTKCCVR